MNESLPGLRASLVALAITAVMLLHPAGLALLVLPFLLAREDRRQAVAGVLVLFTAAGLAGPGLLPHAVAAAEALLNSEAGTRLADTAFATLPLALPGLVAPFLFVRLEQAGPRDPERGLAAAPLLGPSALAPAALVGLAGMALLLGGALLVAWILSADLPLRREAMQLTPEDVAGRATLSAFVARLETRSPR